MSIQAHQTLPIDPQCRERSAATFGSETVLKIIPSDNLWKPQSFCLVAGDRIIGTHKTKDEAEAKRDELSRAAAAKTGDDQRRHGEQPTRRTGVKSAHRERCVESPNAKVSA